MISEDLIISTLRQTTTAQVSEAEENLKQMRGSSDFFDKIISIITSNQNDVIKQAATTQLRLLLHENEELMQQFSLESISEIFNNSSQVVQSTFLFIVDEILSYFIKHAMFEQVLQFIISSIQSGLLSGFMILDELTKLEINEHEYYDQIVPALNLAIEFITSQDITEYTNFQQIVTCVMRSFKQLVVKSSIDAVSEEIISTIYTISAGLLTSEAELSNDLYESLTDAILAPLTVKEGTEITTDFISPIVEPILNILTERTASYPAMTYAFNILEIFLTYDIPYSVIEPMIDHIILQIFIPTFLPPADVSNLDVTQLLDLIFPSPQEKESPASAAATALSAGGHRIASSVLSVASQLEYSDSNIVYSIMFILSKVASFFSEGDSENISFIQNLAFECLSSTDLMPFLAGVVFFTGYKNIEIAGQLVVPLSNVFLETDNDIVAYITLCSLCNTLSVFEDFEVSESKSEIFENIGESINQIIQKVFEMNEKYPTQWMADSLVNFTNFFAPALQSFSIEYTTNLIQMFKQYIDEDSAEAHVSVSTITRAIDKVAKSQEKNEETANQIVSLLMQQVNEMLYESNCSSNYAEEIISILCTCISYSPAFNEELMQIPSMLQKFFEDDDALIESISPAIKVLALKFPDSFEIKEVTNPIYEIATSLLADEEEFCDNYWEYLIIVFQAIFVRCCHSSFALEFIGEISENLADWDLQIHDIVASMATTDPSILVKYPTFYTFWIENTRPAAFLRSAISVFKNFENLPQLAGKRDEILEICFRNIEVLKENMSNDDEMEMDEEDLSFFDVNELCNYPLFKK
ncbi:hypothetical protein TVAG_044050 [Trichomonas vaginalis G3]|uniref:Importin N-terminal domain-containing protein n=1 Tax=Trichomonas vaginalis (strain ATCC PRA-98 / G3) TaxID=412133 RepID=A2E0G5_TRIV3|nr:armadillo (ARM) repeat-containing protein family [Trichomonas vaginalis G3]EAY13845.1 hypothetical protein TVAG_044050 [Trichomonas vaginalis G3]KAI5519854.1 armadillo (ARM) repeat-containing protein family [Trichomonas vaginalis G3]|eukprot:XP_001326068.1 hypothetical protein [Trichomonas vaginalis G3]